MRTAKKELITSGCILFLINLLSLMQALLLRAVFGEQVISKPHAIVLGFYWFAISLGLSVFIRFLVVHAYVRPIKTLSKACKRVANGDFSVYVKPLHTTDRHDYIDKMFLDFNHMVEELGSIETLKTDFFSDVSHEMKTPITVIQNYAELLQHSGLNAEQQSHVTTILTSSQQLNDLITNLLKLTKLEGQTIVPATEPYNLCDQLSESILHFDVQLENKSIDFTADIEDLAIVRTDRDLMDLVWNNLFSNAIKFSEPGGCITLQQTSNEDAVIVSLSDCGCGMDDETLTHIFDKFYQGDASRSTEGNGLGLSLTLRILELLNNKISVTSTLGMGSTFTVTIPIVKEGDLIG